jgi:cadmium resistance protein CadD (predicted permease)
MAASPNLLGLAVGTFVATNVDNLLLSTALLAVAPVERRRHVARGILLASLVVPLATVGVRFALFDVPVVWFATLAAIPALSALRATLALGRHDRDDASPTARGGFAAFLVTLAISADNAAAYLPLLRATGVWGDVGVVTLWACCAVGLIATAGALARHPRTATVVDRIGHLVEPLLYLALAALILLATGVL